MLHLVSSHLAGYWGGSRQGEERIAASLSSAAGTVRIARRLIDADLVPDSLRRMARQPTSIGRADTRADTLAQSRSRCYTHRCRKTRHVERAAVGKPTT